MAMSTSDIISFVFGIGASAKQIAPIPKTSEIISDMFITILTLFKFRDFEDLLCRIQQLQGEGGGGISWGSNNGSRPQLGS
jgi:hypothetical protein